MEKYVPYALLGSVFLVAVVGLLLNLSEEPTANVVQQRQCSSVNPTWVNCVSETGGCPDRYPPFKQWGVSIGYIPTCCCAPLHSEDNYRQVRSLYG